MKKHHSRRESPAGRRASYALRPVEVAPGMTAGGRKAIALLWVDQSRSKLRCSLRRFVAKHGLILAEVQRFGGLVCYEATGHPPALQRLCSFAMVRRWEPVVAATVQEVDMEDFSGMKSVPLAQPSIEGRAHKQPLPPLPGAYGFASK